MPGPAHPGRPLVIALVAVAAIAVLTVGVGAVVALSPWSDPDPPGPEDLVTGYYQAAQRGDCQAVVDLYRDRSGDPTAVEGCEDDLAEVGGELPVTVVEIALDRLDDGPMVREMLGGVVAVALVSATLRYTPDGQPEETTGTVPHTVHQDPDGRWWLVRPPPQPASAVPGLLPERMDGPITLWHRDLDWPMNDAWSDVVREFEAARPDLPVEVTGHRPPDLPDALAVAEAAGRLPHVFHSTGDGTFHRQVRDGVIRDLTDDLADVIATLTPAALAPYTVNGRVYGIPYHAAGYGFWFRRDLFERPEDAIAQVTDVFQRETD